MLAGGLIVYLFLLLSGISSEELPHFFPPFHSPVSGHAGNFQGLFIMIKAATSWGTFVAISPRYMARSEIAGPYSRCMFTLLETTNSFP